MSLIIDAVTSLPSHRYHKDEISFLLKTIWPDKQEVIDRFSKTSGVTYRHLALPLDLYPTLKGLKVRNDAFVNMSMDLLQKSLSILHDRFDFNWNEVDAIFSTTVTGICVPSLEARIMNKFPLNKNLIRMPLFGLGCLGGLGILNRSAQWLKSHPYSLVLCLASEACSLTFQLDQPSMANLIGTQLFGDGAAVVLMAGEKHPLANKAQFKMIDHYASFYSNTEDVMGWEVLDTGFGLVLSGSVPEMVTNYVAKDLSHFLGQHQLKKADVKYIISHPGGPKVLKAMAQVTGFDEEGFRHSWNSLNELGNLSSVSILNVLERSIKAGGLKNKGLMAAMGPGFNCELALIEK